MNAMSTHRTDNLSATMKIAVFLNRFLPRGKGALPRYLGSLVRGDRSRSIITREGALLALEPTSLDVYACILNSGRTWNWHVLAACAAVLEPGNVFYDIGANIGFMSMELARIFRAADGLPTIRIVSFEPLPVLAEAIAASARLNGLQNFIVRDEVVSDSDGTAELFLGSHSIHASTRARESRSTLLRRPMVRIDTLVADGTIPAPAVIKIDVEGGELAAFRGAEETIRRHRPHIVFESDENTGRFGYTRSELLAYLESLAPYRFFSVSAAGDSLAELRWDSDSTREPADVLACVSDDCGIGTVARKLRRWSSCRKIERASSSGGSLGEDAGSRSSLG